MAELKEVKPLKTADEDDVLLEMENQNGNDSAKTVGLYFNEGGYKIDYVLVYERNPEEEENDDEKGSLAEELEEKRTAFEKVIKDEGLLLEREMVVSAQVSRIN